MTERASGSSTTLWCSMQCEALIATSFSLCFVQGTGMRFWDTMSMHIIMYGLADKQIALYKSSDVEQDALKFV